MELEDKIDFAELMLRSYIENGNLRGLLATGKFQDFTVLMQAEVIFEALSKTTQINPQQIFSFKARIQGPLTLCKHTPSKATSIESLERISLISCINDIQDALQS